MTTLQQLNLDKLRADIDAEERSHSYEITIATEYARIMADEIDRLREENAALKRAYQQAADVVMDEMVASNQALGLYGEPEVTRLRQLLAEAREMIEVLMRRECVNESDYRDDDKAHALLTRLEAESE